MSPELEALGRRAVARTAWLWMAGMRALEDYQLDPDAGGGEQEGRPHRVYRGNFWDECEDSVPAAAGPGLGEMLPDFSDPATVGCLLALVREAWGVPLRVGEGDKSAFDHTERAAYVEPLGGPDFEADTLPAALVAALEAAP